MVPFVRSNQVVNVNGENFAWPANPNGVLNGMDIPTAGTQIIGSFWRIPVMDGPRVVDYAFLVANSAIKPQADALKVLQVKLTGTGGITAIMMAIADNDDLPTTTPANQFAYLADGLGGSLPVMPTVTIPVPIMQQGPQVTNPTTGAKTFIFAFPANPAALEYQVNGMWINGVLITPTMTGLTTVAAVAVQFNTDYSDNGTWSATGDVLKLVSAPTDVEPVSKAGIDVELKPKAWCFDLTAYSTPAAVNGVKFGASDTIPLDTFMLTDNPTVLLNVLKAKMSVGTTFSTTVANKLGILTVQAQPKLYNGVTLVESATAGTC